MVANMLSEMSLIALVYDLFKRSEPSPMNKEQFSRWLTGFIDGCRQAKEISKYISTDLTLE